MSNIPTRGYIAGKPVSRWEASDSDNIDIEYKNLDRPGRQAWCGECFSGPKGLALKALILIVIFCFGLVFGYVIRKGTCPGESKPLVAVDDGFVPIQQDYDDEIRQQLQERISHPLNLEDSIKTITKHLPLSGVGQTNHLLYYTRNMWATFHLDTATVRNYSVQLMYPNYTMEGVNKVSIVTDNETLFETQTNETNIHPNYLPFNAYSHSGHVRGPLVYGHYGRREDFDKLKELQVDVNQTILLIRYGKIHPSNKVQHAEREGALGVILYPDPYDYVGKHSGDGSSGYDTSGTWWLPGDAVVRSSVRYWMSGDPLTPDYPSVDDLPRLSNSQDFLTSLPVFPVSYNDAKRLMQNLSGRDVPSDWVGGLNVTYKTGPGYIVSNQELPSEVDLNVKNEFLFREIHNIMATIHGQYEKDHYIIIGAHIDSWTMGAIDAGTGYAALMDLIRTFSDQRQTGWRPRRTIIFAGWDASKYGHIGAYEWVQEYEEQLTSGAEYPDLPSYPVYATLNDTQEYLQTYIDPTFNVTTALVRVLCDIILRLSDSAILPFNVTGYQHIMERGMRGLKLYESQLQDANLRLDLLSSAVNNFTSTTREFQNKLASIEKRNMSEFEAQFLNDKLIRLSRAFIHSGAVLSQPQYRNVLIAPHPENLNEEIIFPGIINALLQAKVDTTDRWKEEVRKQFAVLVVCLQRARNIVTESYPTESL
ncbi:hypothetical protein C0Q70_04105 [Pomacea canaliculata]|uniref:Peptidase M28 domain-containing protein n=1 Tax=Pomacea canaliculata TaxID=400727 RepID=A0A2T7PUL5_POMCA|nr:hypothetical protein C0Q70_04105 [Pomacea canaliculata]